MQLEGLWVSYRMTSLSEADLYVTIPRFSILDIRPDTKPEMRLMLGSCSDIPKQSSVGSLPFSIGFKRLDSKAPVNINIPNSTMFVMDYRWRLSSQLFVIRVQQPRVLVVLDFLIAVCEFLVPGLGAITGREELMDPRNDPIGKKNGVVLLDPLYKQREDVVHLSANSRLIADAPAVDDYTYDGCGKTIRLVEVNKTKELHSNGFRPIIIIGRGKSLRFVNVKIEVLSDFRCLLLAYYLKTRVKYNQLGCTTLDSSFTINEPFTKREESLLFYGITNYTIVY